MKIIPCKHEMPVQAADEDGIFIFPAADGAQLDPRCILNLQQTESVIRFQNAQPGDRILIHLADGIRLVRMLKKDQLTVGTVPPIKINL